MGPSLKMSKNPSTSGSGPSTSSNVKGSFNLYFSQKPNEKRKGGPIILESNGKKSGPFARWMYDAGLHFNYINYRVLVNSLRQ